MTKPIKARPTVYNGIPMRSRLEAGFAAWLDSSGFEWAYEPTAFATENGQYLPDFRIANAWTSWQPSPITAYVEVKPDSYHVHIDSPCCLIKPEGCGNWENATKLRRQAQIVGASDPDAVFLVMQPSAQWAIRRFTWPEWAEEPIPYRTERIRLAQWHGDTVGFVLPVQFGRGPWGAGYWEPRERE